MKNNFIILKIKNSIFFFILLLSIFSCKEKKQSESSQIILYKDDLGREIVLHNKPQRALSLAPSLTEILFFVCDSNQIVGVTQNCNFPPAAKNKKKIVNYPSLDFEGVLQMKPDIIFSVEGLTPLYQAKRLEGMGIPIYYQKYEKIKDILQGIRDVGKIMGQRVRADKLADSLETERKKLKSEVKNKNNVKTVLAITWSDPIYVYGKNTIFTDKLQLIGAKNAVDSLFSNPYPQVTREYILKINPDVIIGGSFEKMDSTFFKLYPELKRIKAYKTKQVYSVNDDLMSRPSPRVLESVLELKKAIDGKQ